MPNKPFNPIARENARSGLTAALACTRKGQRMASDRAIAQQTQEKFQFYFLALTFTLLAAAIQTSQFGRSTVEDVLELAGWIGLLAAGIVALWNSAS